LRSYSDNMKREELQKRYDEQLAKVNGLVGDNNELKEAIDNLSSLRAQLAVVPMAFYLEEKEVLKKVDLGAVEFGISERCAYFRTKGGYRIFVKPGVGLYDLIAQFIESHETKDDMTAEEKENLQLNTNAFKFLATAPLVAATDLPLMYNIAAEVMEFIQKQTDEALGNTETPEEDGKRNVQFEDAVNAMEQIADGVKDKDNAEENNQGEGES